MYTDPIPIVAFTGHRTCRAEIGGILADVLQRLHAEGFHTFLSGMAVGFDLAAAEAVLLLRQKCPDVRLVCVVPFDGQEARYTPTDRERYRAVLAAADGVEYVCEMYHAGCYAQRNDRLVAMASVLVAWYDGSPGGTRYTVRRACKLGLRIIHLHGASQMQLF